MTHHRRSIRLPGYDYSEPGDYYLTIVSHARAHIFGAVDGNRVRLTPIGQIARDEWLKTPSLRPNIELGEFVIMPNHFHAIVHINGDDSTDTMVNINESENDCWGTPRQTNPFVGAYGHTPLQGEQHPLFRSPSRTIGALVRGYKGAVTKRVNELRGTPGAPVWQRNYFESVICSDHQYAQIAAYIENNPANWTNDRENRPG